MEGLLKQLLGLVIALWNLMLCYGLYGGDKSKKFKSNRSSWIDHALDAWASIETWQIFNSLNLGVHGLVEEHGRPAMTLVLQGSRFFIEQNAARNVSANK
ncbi:hypothetical protein Pfo_007066 [Paulownia fortunei]|nr:hypothetical protein Pfo_007066 [Paulownia fortunei]